MQFSKFHLKERRRIPAEINLTSLVDIIFNLLLFFMLTTSIAETPGIEISLPKAESASLNKTDKSLSIVLGSDQSILVNNKAISANELSILLKDFKNNNGRVFIKADEMAAHGNVVKILDIVKSNGVKQVAIATSKSNLN